MRTSVVRNTSVDISASGHTIKSKSRNVPNKPRSDGWHGKGKRMNSSELRVCEVPIKDVKPYINNPRFNDQAVFGVAASIKAYGFQQPIVVDRNMTIIVGHTRYKAAKLLGLEFVPVAFADDLTEAQARAYRLADNRTAELATWNDEELANELKDLTESGYLFPYDYNLEGVEIDADMASEFLQDVVVNTDGTAGNETGASEKESKDIICPRCGCNLSEVSGDEA